AAGRDEAHPEAAQRHGPGPIRVLLDGPPGQRSWALHLAATDEGVAPRARAQLGLSAGPQRALRGVLPREGGLPDAAYQRAHAALREAREQAHGDTQDDVRPLGPPALVEPAAQARRGPHHDE